VITLDTFELKREQHRLSKRVLLRDSFDKVKTIGGTECLPIGNKLLAVVTVCEFPSLKLIDKQTYLLDQPLPYKIGFQSYREMPAIIEAFNKLEQEPDVLLVKGMGINHPRKFGIASHLGIALNIATIGIIAKSTTGKVEKGKIMLNNDIVGFEIKTKEHANPVYAAPGSNITLGSVLNVVSKSISFPHKLPEPMHIAHKIAKKKIKEMG
jgi:deoxyribonuclease V